MDSQQIDVKKFWEEYSCGEKLYLDSSHLKGYQDHEKKRYELEPYIIDFLKFDLQKTDNVLEIGVGLGADHKHIVKQGYKTYGIDLTQRAIDHTKNRLFQEKLTSNLSIGNAENLKFPDNFFNGIYSWGVIHHSPNPIKAISEIHRVLKPGGTLKIMLYHKYSIVIFMLWIRYALMRFNPFLSFSQVSSSYLESPGTKVYTKSEIREMFKNFRRIEIDIVLSHGDLLNSNVGQRHRGIILQLGKFFLPRKLIRRFFNSNGLFMLINIKK
tara:strand:- start:161 stop:967 length:807 start_codon:yes stop_codon:yes gene_type:complete